MMWYTSFIEPLDVDTTLLSIGVATSEDGFSWERHSSNPVITPDGSPGWNSKKILNGEVLLRQDGGLLITAYGASLEAENPAFPDFTPGRIGLWYSAP